MLRVATVALAVLLLAAAPAAAECVPSEQGPLRTAEVDLSPRSETLDSAVVLCDRRTGQERTLARAFLRDANTERPSGDELHDADVAGRYAAWIRRTAGRRSTTARIVLFDVEQGRVVRRTVRRWRGLGDSHLDVAVSDRGELAWIAGAPDSEHRRLMLQRRHETPRRIASGYLGGVEIEDDRFLLWNGDEGVRAVVLPGRRPLMGCPERRASEVLLSTSELLVTARWYEGPGEDSGERLVRACWRPGGRERVLVRDHFESSHASVVGSDGPWVVLSSASGGRYIACSFVRVLAVDVRSGRPGRQSDATEGVGQRCATPDLPPRSGAAIAVTALGVPAWVVTNAQEARLMTVGRRGRLVELDRGPLGAISGLRAEGDQIIWTGDGTARSATP